MNPHTYRQSKVEAYRSLIVQNVISQEELDAALASPMDCDSILMERYHVPKSVLLKSLSDYYGCPSLEYTEQTQLNDGLLKQLKREFLQQHFWFPLQQTNRAVDIVIDDPFDFDKGLAIKFAFPGLTLRFIVALRCDIAQFLLRGLHPLSGILGQLEQEAALQNFEEGSTLDLYEQDSAIVHLANQIIRDAYHLGSSDIHIEPKLNQRDTLIRFRVDGTCFQYLTIPASSRHALVSRLKIMARMDIAERRKPQDGKIKFPISPSKEIELRVATIPTAGSNEDVVLRILNGRGPMPLDTIDLSPETLHNLQAIAQKPYGIILCVGPTGSGKTTTLHAILDYINTHERKIWTAEDPIEITQEGLRQVQVHSKIGFTFAMAMRAFLRADPDVIMIGEMRDKETADIALEASLTGHLVLSTLHTNNSVETISRLLDMGCDPFNFSDALLGILAKRLCKRLCLDCRESYEPSEEEYEDLLKAYGEEFWRSRALPDSSQIRLFRGGGCHACHHTGFQGRLALYELLLGSEDLRMLIQEKSPTPLMVRLALKQGMSTLVQDGIHKVLEGQTTFQQVLRVAMK